MSNHELGFVPASVQEASNNVGAEFRRPNLAEQAHSRAINMLHATRRHYTDALAITVAMIGIQAIAAQPDSAYADHHQIQEPVVGLYQAFLPVAGRGADFRIVHPGYTPTPIIDPTEPRPSPTVRIPSPTPTEVRQTATPEKPHEIIGLPDSTIGGYDAFLDPYDDRQASLAQIGLKSTPDNLINFDAEADGTGAILASDGTAVAYRLKLTEPGIDGDHFFEISIDELKKLVSAGVFDRLIQREHLRSAEADAGIITKTIASKTKLFDATNGTESNPLAKKDNPQEYIQSPHILAILGHTVVPQNIIQTHSVTDSSDQSRQENSPLQDGKNYGELKPVGAISSPSIGTWHRFVESHQELPTDSGVTFNIDMRYKNFGVVHLSYLADQISPNPRGFGVVVSGNQLFMGNYHQAEVDGPYVADIAIEKGVMNISISFRDEKRDYVEVGVTDNEGVKTYYPLKLKWPLDQRVVGLEAAMPMAEREYPYVNNIDMQIPANPDRLVVMANDPLLAGLNELNTSDGKLGRRIGITNLAGQEGANHDNFDAGALLRQADMLFLDRAPIHSRGKSETYDEELPRTSDPIIQLRPHRNAELLSFIRNMRETNPRFFAVLPYDIRNIAINDAGYKAPEFRRDIKLMYEGAEKAGDLLATAPMGLISPSGDMGDFLVLNRLVTTSRPLDQQAHEVAQEYVKLLPEGATWNVIPQLDYRMPLGSSQKDKVLIIMEELMKVDRVSVKGIIASGIPSSPMSGANHENYLIQFRNALNNIGVVMHMRDSDGGVLTQEQVDRILHGQIVKGFDEPQDGIKIQSDPRNTDRLSPGAKPKLVINKEIEIVRRHIREETKNN